MKPVTKIETPVLPPPLSGFAALKSRRGLIWVGMFFAIHRPRLPLDELLHERSFR